MRTTFDIDDRILREVEALHESEGRSMGEVVSETLAEALVHRRSSRARPSFNGTSRDMRPRVDPSDKDTVEGYLFDLQTRHERRLSALQGKAPASLPC